MKTPAKMILSLILTAACAHAGGEAHARRVKYGQQDVIAVQAKLRFTTLIILPKEETILDFTCGDKEFWVVNGANNLAYVKPAKENSETNLNLVTASGNVYSFVLREITEESEARPDLKIFVEPKDESVVAAMSASPRFVPAEEIANYREQVSIAREQARQAKKQAEQEIEAHLDKFLGEYPQKLQFDYRFARDVKPFSVSSIWNDGRFTYIRAAARELPALYEIKDGKPNLLHYDFRDGMFVVQKVIDRGYLVIGKARLDFAPKESK